jgi:hypothetical protein
MEQEVQGEKDGSRTSGELKKCRYPTRRFLMAQIWSEAHQGVPLPPVSLNLLILLKFFFSYVLKSYKIASDFFITKETLVLAIWLNY